LRKDGRHADEQVTEEVKDVSLVREEFEVEVVVEVGVEVVMVVVVEVEVVVKVEELVVEQE